MVMTPVRFLYPTQTSGNLDMNGNYPETRRFEKPRKSLGYYINQKEIEIRIFNTINANDTSLIAQINNFIDYLHSLNISIKKQSKIEEYFLHYPGMLEPVRQCIETTYQKFNPNTHIELAMYDDPEISFSHLVLNLRKDHYGDDFMNEIDELQDTLLNIISSMPEWFLITTDFQ